MFLRVLYKVIETEETEKKINQFKESRIIDEKKLLRRNNRCTFINLQKQ